ncbi:hypothetical protein MED193_00535 [Roseobacter sp. MED193]|nr:hypothetical protein MED193_00535 [Roseobacter sp. MED193]
MLGILLGYILPNLFDSLQVELFTHHVPVPELEIVVFGKCPERLRQQGGPNSDLPF